MATNNFDELGITIVPRRSRRIEAEKMLDLDFAEHISLMSVHMTGAQDLLECGKTGLYLNAKKTEHMTFNVNTQDPLLTCHGDHLKQVTDFKYHGSRM
jgi:hypothetical protein